MTFVETLADRGGEGDLAAAEVVIDRAATVLLETASDYLDVRVLRMRALLADGRGEAGLCR